MGDFLRDKEPNVVAVLASVNGEKITFLAVCGGKDMLKLDDALASVDDFVAVKLGL